MYPNIFAKQTTVFRVLLNLICMQIDVAAYLPNVTTNLLDTWEYMQMHLEQVFLKCTCSVFSFLVLLNNYLLLFT